MALPMLDAMTPAFAKEQTDGMPRRMVAINVDLGFMPEEFFPKAAGRDFELSPYLELLKDFRDDLTVFSGISHPEVDGGHQADVSFLTGAPHPRSAGFKNTISLDQYAAQHIGNLEGLFVLKVCVEDVCNPRPVGDIGDLLTIGIPLGVYVQPVLAWDHVYHPGR